MRGPLTPFSLPAMNNMEEGYNGGKPGQQQQQPGGGFGQKGDNGDGGGVNNKVKYTMPGVLHFIQHEWSNFELERSHWEIDRAELQARIAFLQGERKGQDNLKNDLIRRIQMLEHALRAERAKYHKLKYGTEIPQSEMQLPSASSSAQDEYSSIPEVGADSEAPLSSVSNVSWKQGRQLLREYLHEIGYTDTIIDVRSSRVRNLLGLNNNNNLSGIEQGQSDNNQINGNNYNKRFSDNQGQCSPTKRTQQQQQQQNQKKLLDVESAVMANFEFLSEMRSTSDSGDVDMDDDGVDDDDDDDDEDDDEMGMADDVIDMTSICKFGPDDVDAEAEEVVNELQLLTEDISNKENEQNDWSMLQ